MSDQNGLNLEQVVWELPFVPDAPRFRAAWQAALDSSEGLRLAFTWHKTDHEPIQSVAPRAELPFRELDYTGEAAPRLRVERFLEQDRREGLELSSVPLMRVSLLVLAPNRAVCVWTVHHAIIDGRAFALVLQLVFAHYRSKPRQLHQLAAPPYSAFLRWLEGHDGSEGVQHFKHLLDGCSEPTPLPLSPPGQATGQAGHVSTRIDQTQTGALDDHAHGAGVTMSTLVQLAWALLLARYTGQNDVVFGSTWSGRAGTIEHAEHCVGPFISTLPVRVQLTPSQSVLQLAQALRKQHLALRPYTHTPVSEIKAKSALSGAPQLFHTLVVFDHTSLQGALEHADPAWGEQRVWSRSQAGYALTLAAHVDGGELVLELEYDTGLYDAADAQRLLDDYSRVLLGIASHVNHATEQLPLLEPALEAQLTVLEARRELVLACTPPIVRILEQVRLRPEAPAVRQLGGQSLTYGELAQRTLGLAHTLEARGIRPGSLVGIWLPRGIDTIVSMLAVHALGAAFLPVHASAPVQRAQFIASDARVELLLVDESRRGQLSGVNELDLSSFAPASMLRGAVEPAPEAPAYVIYTSGSTGLPKGCMVPHSALANHAHAVEQLFGLAHADRVLQFATPTFDVALEEILPTLSAGAELVLRDEAMVGSARSFFEAVTAEQVSVLNLPTAFWHQLVFAQLPWPSCVRLLVVGGERASAESHRKFRASAPSSLRFLNAYGPTEATITSTVYDDAEGDHGPEGLPIGTPLSGVSHFVLDAQQRPVPPGCVGQLYIGGAGLALGYLHNEELSRKAFVPHPFRAGARLYATGDLVKLSKRGNYLFVDRPDNQVKLRGFRIELGEIEAQLRRHAAVSEAVAVVREQGADRMLVGFVVADESATSEEELLAHLATALPAHMLPARIVIAGTLPTTSSGKVDRRALATEPLPAARAEAREPLSTRASGAFWLPTLQELWGQLLGLSAPDPAASFFDLGGNSLLVVRLFSELEQRFGKTCNVAAFFRNPTLLQLAELLQAAKPRSRNTVIELAPGTPGVAPLFFAPGLTGRAVDFVHLVDAMSSDAPIYALQLHAFADAERPDESLRDLVRDAVDLMQQVQPRGPYSVAGFSAGGTFAVAICEELAARGEPMSLVALIDSVPPATVRAASPFTNPQRLSRLTRTVVGRVREILEQPHAYQQLVTRTRHAARRGIARWYGSGDHYEPKVVELFGELPSFSRREVESMQRYLHAVVSHRFGAVHDDLVLFRVPLDPPEGPFERDLGWGQVTTGRVTIEQVEGRHNDLMTTRGCRVLGHRLSRHLSLRPKRA